MDGLSLNLSSNSPMFNSYRRKSWLLQPPTTTFSCMVWRFHLNLNFSFTPSKLVRKKTSKNMRRLQIHCEYTGAPQTCFGRSFPTENLYTERRGTAMEKKFTRRPQRRTEFNNLMVRIRSNVKQCNNFTVYHFLHIFWHHQTNPCHANRLLSVRCACDFVDILSERSGIQCGSARLVCRWTIAGVSRRNFANNARQQKKENRAQL